MYRYVSFVAAMITSRNTANLKRLANNYIPLIIIDRLLR